VELYKFSSRPQQIRNPFPVMGLPFSFAVKLKYSCGDKYNNFDGC
jgi:hypothetical protein